jgi:hypothetical protein
MNVEMTATERIGALSQSQVGMICLRIKGLAAQAKVGKRPHLTEAIKAVIKEINALDVEGRILITKMVEGADLKLLCGYQATTA